MEETARSPMPGMCLRYHRNFIPDCTSIVISKQEHCQSSIIPCYWDMSGDIYLSVRTVALYGGMDLVINITKPDGKHVYNTCTYSGSDVTVELTNQALAASGTAYCDIEIRTSDDSQIITSASFTMEIEKSQRSENTILSSNEFTDLENRIKGHIENIDNTDAAVKKAESARATAENARVKAENERAAAEKTRQENENTRIQQEKQRQQDTSQAVKNAEDATTATKQATKDCKEVTDRAEDALQNQEQLEATLNTATQIRQEVSQMQSAAEAAKKQVEQDKKDIDDTIQNSLLASAEKILESVQDYFNRAERRIRIRHLKRMYRIRERKERHDKKVSGLFMKRVVFTLILAAFIFTVVMIFVFLRMGSEPSTLIENVFRFLSVEGGAMALIKSVKTVKGTSNGEIQHNDEPEQNDEEVQG